MEKKLISGKKLNKLPKKSAPVKEVVAEAPAPLVKEEAAPAVETAPEAVEESNTGVNTGASVEVSRVIGGTVIITFTPPANYQLVCIETATVLLECLQPGEGNTLVLNEGSRDIFSNVYSGDRIRVTFWPGEERVFVTVPYQVLVLPVSR